MAEAHARRETASPARRLADLPAPPGLPLALRVAWSECRGPWLAVATLYLLTGLTPAAQVALTTRLLDGIIRLPHAGAAGFAAILPSALALIAVTLASSTLSHLTIPFKRRLGFDLRSALDGRTLAVAAASPLALFDRDDWYDLVQAAGASAGAAAEQLLEPVAWLLQRTASVLTVGLLLAAAAWWLPLGLLAGLVPTAAWELWQGDRRRRHTLRQAPDQRLLGYLADLLAGDAGEGEAAEVRLYGLASHLLARWRALFRRLGAAQVRFQARQNAAEVPPNLIRLSFFLGGVLALGWALARGHIDAGGFMALVVGLGQFDSAATGVAADVRRIRVRSNALADFGRLAAAAHLSLGTALPAAARPRTAPPQRPSAPKPTPFPRPLREGIAFDHITFSYAGTPGRPVLRDLCLSLRAGECLALVGANGAGKSTLVKLLLGLYEPDQGHLRGDGIDLGAMDPSVRRAAIAPVFQDHLRPRFTAAEAIGFGALHSWAADGGAPRPDPARLHAAARAAGIAEHLQSLPLGYETPLGRTLDERGSDLSGGQWQRLAIARALYADPEVLVLDEPAAALDPRAEADLYARFARLAARRRTTLLVTHRLGAARLADRIAVLAGGRIAEQGTHDTLLATGGHYARMWAAQAQWYR